MPAVDLDELHGAVDWVSPSFSNNEAFICRQTGRIVWISEDGGLDDEENEPLDDVEDPEKYLPVPTRHELDIDNRLAFDFVAQNLPERYDQVRSIFRRKGAYGSFKELLAHRGLLESWYAYSEERTLRALKDWCDSEGLVIEP